MDKNGDISQKEDDQPTRWYENWQPWVIIIFTGIILVSLVSLTFYLYRSREETIRQMSPGWYRYDKGLGKFEKLSRTGEKQAKDVLKSLEKYTDTNLMSTGEALKLSQSLVHIPSTFLGDLSSYERYQISIEKDFPNLVEQNISNVSVKDTPTVNKLDTNLKLNNTTGDANQNLFGSLLKEAFGE